MPVYYAFNKNVRFLILLGILMFYKNPGRDVAITLVKHMHHVSLTLIAQYKNHIRGRCSVVM